MLKFYNYIIRDKDTIQAISTRFLNDPNKWIELAVLNNLDYPFIVPLDAVKPSNTKTTGDYLLIPKELSNLPKEYFLPSAGDFDLFSEAFGTDLFLTSDLFSLSQTSLQGEVESNLYGDLKTVTGLQNLKQAIIHRLLTVRGELEYHPEYGSNITRIIGNKNTFEWREKCKLEIQSTVLSDPRVEKVDGITVYHKGNSVFISCTINGNLLINAQIPL